MPFSDKYLHVTPSKNEYIIWLNDYIYLTQTFYISIFDFNTTKYWEYSFDYLNLIWTSS